MILRKLIRRAEVRAARFVAKRASVWAGAWGACRVQPVPPRDLDRYRVSVNRPRPGRDGGRWVLRVRAPGRGQESREPTELDAVPETRQEAEQLAALREHELNNGKPTFAELFDLYVVHQRDVEKVAPSTLASYRPSRDYLVRCGISGLTEETLDRHKINTAKAELCKRLKNNSARTKAVHWAACWRWAYQQGLVDVPWPETKRIKVPKADRCKKMAYTEEEIPRVLAYFLEVGRPAGRYHTFAWALAETGARADAMANVKGSDVTHDPESGGAWIRFGKTKTGPERRVLVSPALAQALPRADPGRWVWESRRRGAPGPLHYPNVTQLLRRWLKAEGLFGLRDLHSLRRSAVGKLLGSGRSVEEGRRVTGQSAQVFLSYAERAHFAPRKACEALWLDPLGTQVQGSGPTVEDRRGQVLDSQTNQKEQPQEVVLQGPSEPSSGSTGHHEIQMIRALRLVIAEGSGWPRVESILEGLRREIPPPSIEA